MGLLVHVRSALKHALESFMNVSIIDVVENESEKRAGRDSRRVTNGQYGWALHEAFKLYHGVIIVNSCDYDGRQRTTTFFKRHRHVKPLPRRALVSVTGAILTIGSRHGQRQQRQQHDEPTRRLGLRRPWT
jgi:hypothetical protein